MCSCYPDFDQPQQTSIIKLHKLKCNYHKWDTPDTGTVRTDEQTAGSKQQRTSRQVNIIQLNIQTEIDSSLSEAHYQIFWGSTQHKAYAKIQDTVYNN